MQEEEEGVKVEVQAVSSRRRRGARAAPVVPPSQPAPEAGAAASTSGAGQTPEPTPAADALEQPPEPPELDPTRARRTVQLQALVEHGMRQVRASLHMY